MLFFFVMSLCPPSSTLFPYTTLFRSSFYLRDIVYVSMPDAIDRDVEQWADFQTNNHDFSRERSWLLVDRKSTRLNSSHQIISYAVFCLKKKRRFASRRESR